MKKGIAIVVVLIVLAGCAAGAVMYHNNKIREMREAGAAGVRAMVRLEDYGEDQQKDISEALDAAERKIAEAKKQEEIDAAKEEFGAAVSGLKTLAMIRDEGLAGLEKVASIKDYRAEQQEEIKAILADSEERIGSAGSEEDVKKVIKEAKKKVSGIKTDKQLTEEEQKAAAEQAAAARAAAARAAAAKKKSSSTRRSGSGGCVGDSAKNFY